MSNLDRISALQQKHRDIEAKLHQLENQPGASDADIIELKKSKLAIKDEIHNLSTVDTSCYADRLPH